MAENNGAHDEQLAVRFTKGQRALVEEEAAREQRSLASFIRFATMRFISQRTMDRERKRKPTGHEASI